MQQIVDWLADFITEDPSLFQEHRNEAAERQVVSELRLFHERLGIPLDYRIYWPRPEVMQAAGLRYPAWVRQAGWDMRQMPLPRNVRNAKQGAGGVEYIIGSTPRDAGWLWLLGHDDIGRRAVVIAVPPNASKGVLAKLAPGQATIVRPPPPPRRPQ